MTMIAVIAPCRSGVPHSPGVDRLVVKWLALRCDVGRDSTKAFNLLRRRPDGPSQLSPIDLEKRLVREGRNSQRIQVALTDIIADREIPAFLS